MGVGGEAATTGVAARWTSPTRPRTRACRRIPNNGGVVLKNPVIVTVTFPGDALEAKEQQFGAEIGGLKWWSTVHDSYGVGAATSGGNVSFPTSLPAAMSDGEVELWLQ